MNARERSNNGACSCLRSDVRLCARQDEPTSGLDAFNAQSVMSSLKLLASTGRAIVACIHQPRSGITALFDALLLLSEGRVMFSGAAPACLAFLARCGFACPQHTNPADFYLDVVSVSFSSPEAEAASRARVALLADAYAGERDEQLRALRQAAPAMEPAEAVPAGSRAVAEGVVAVRLDGGANGDDAAKHDDSSRSNNNNGNGKEPADVRRPATLLARLRRRGVEWRALGARAGRLAARQRLENGINLVRTVIFSLLLGLIWLNVGRDATGAPADLRNLGGLLFFSIGALIRDERLSIMCALVLTHAAQ
jgi:hypothetical protein